MKAVQEIHSACLCGLELKPDIWRCPHHVYRKGRQEFVSVSKVIKTLLPPDYAGVDSIVLEIARLRGSFVDTYFSEWLLDSSNVLALPDVEAMIAPRFPRDGAKHAEDTIVRIDMLLDWWIGKGWKATAVQKTVYSEADGVAGTMDLATANFILDVKVVSKLQPNYKLQLGAYSAMNGESHDVGILHVMKDGVKLQRFDTMQCREQWKAALAWYKALKELA